MLGATIGVKRGGRLAHVAEFRLRRWPLLIVAVGIQLSLGWLPTPARWALVVVCCVLVVTWSLANLGQSGMRVGLALLLIGILANTIVIAANRGMPVDIQALVVSGRSAHTDLARGFLYKHTTMTSHTSLALLADRFPVPGIKEVLSIGDLIMLAGVAGIACSATRPRRVRRPLPSQVIPSDRGVPPTLPEISLTAEEHGAPRLLRHSRA